MKTIALEQKINPINWDLDLYSIILHAIPKTLACRIHRVNAGSHNQKKFEWLSVAFNQNFLPDSGWKLHVSATVYNAKEVLLACLAVLLKYQFNFKISGSIDFLAYLNENIVTQEQRGKFITVYSHDDAEVVKLAHELHKQTQHFTSPNIISDHALSNNSNVYYRYGIFYPNFTQSLWGGLLAEIKYNEKKYIDIKNKNAAIYAIIQDPFSKASSVCNQNNNPEDTTLKEKGIAKSAILNNSGDSLTALCFDILNRRRCILKIAHHKSIQDMSGKDSKTRLMIESEILKKLKPLCIAPQWYDAFHNELNQYCLIMEDLSGMDLFQYLHKNIMEHHFSHHELLTLSLKIAIALKKMHDFGIIHSDLKLSNLLLLENKDIRIIDFNSAYDTSTDTIIFACGTKGYSSKNRDQGKLPTISDDIYSYGAILYYLFGSINSDIFPLEVGQTETAISFLNKKTPSYIIELIHFCLQGKYKDFTEIVNFFGRMINRKLDDQGAGAPKTHYYEKLDYLINIYLNLTYDEDTKKYFVSPTLIGNNEYTDLRGLAGSLLAIVTAAFSHSNKDKYSETILCLSQELINEKLPYNPIPGLYVGQSSKALALLYAGVLLENQTLIFQSELYMDQINQMPLLSPDLFNGVAGRLRTNVIFFILTEKEIYKKQAKKMVDFLFEQKVESNNLIFWYNPTTQSTIDNFELNREEILLGYAHGIAGIADSLVDYYVITEDNETKMKIQKMISSIIKGLILHSIPLKNNRGLMWPGKPTEKPLPAYWCHGGAGIGLFISRAMRYQLISKNNSLIKKILYPIIQHTKNGAPILCHGLVGSIESILDISLHTHINLDETLNTFESILALWLRTYINNGCISSNFMFDFHGYLTGIPGIISVYSRLALKTLPNPLHIEFANYLLARKT